MSTKRKRRSRKKKFESKEQADSTIETVEDVVVEDTIKVLPFSEMPKLEPTEEENILLTAPVLPWKIDKTYIDKDFRKAYVALLTNLVNLHNLPYNVNQTGALMPK